MGDKKNYIFGYHSVMATLATMPQDVEQLFLQPKERDPKFIEAVTLANQHYTPIQYLGREALNEMIPLVNHQGIIAAVKYSGEYSENYLRVLQERHGQQLFLLILDGVQDPHNLGACLRTANAAGVHGVIVPKDRACGINATVYKVASGAVGNTPIIRVTNLVRTINSLKKQGVWIYGLSEEAKSSLYQTQLAFPLAMVFGSEGAGVRRLTKEACDLLLQIPTYGVVDNLNVSVAVGITLFAALQQREVK